MTFDVIERSNQDGLPVALYEFQFGSTVWRYCGDEEDITVGGNVYSALAIQDGGIRMTGEPADDTMSITVDSTMPIAVMLNGAPPSDTIWVNIRRHHHGDTDAPIVWVGYISSRQQATSKSVTLKCKMLTAGFARDGLRLSYGRQCPHALYGIDCRVDKEAFAVVVEVENLVGNTVYSDALTEVASLNNGFFEWSRFSGAIERRGIEIHSDDHFSILGTSAGLSVGDLIKVYPGCSRTRTDCKNKFDNIANFGGFPHLPGTSPFNGDPVF